jgi:hypothetical protein
LSVQGFAETANVVGIPASTCAGVIPRCGSPFAAVLRPGGEVDAGVQLIVMAEFRQANYSPTHTAPYDAFRGVSQNYFPGTPVVPHITSGYIENQHYRPLGINAYGFNPYAATEEEGNTEPGNDERTCIEEVRRVLGILFDMVTAVGELGRAHGWFSAAKCAHPLGRRSKQFSFTKLDRRFDLHIAVRAGEGITLDQLGG